MSRPVVFSPEARDDLLELFAFIADRAGERRARAYTDRIVSFCNGLSDFSERGTRRDELRPGLRTIGFARRMTLAFHVTGESVVIDRILYGGRDLGKAFGRQESQV